MKVFSRILATVEVLLLSRNEDAKSLEPRLWQIASEWMIAEACILKNVSPMKY